MRYDITQQQLDKLLDAGKPMPYLVIGGHAPESPQVRANRAWAALGKEMGFDHMTVQPIPGQPQTAFTAKESKDGRPDTL